MTLSQSQTVGVHSLERAGAMKCIFIHGPISSGKLTIGTRLAELTGYRLFHNHLAVDLALSMFEFGTDAFVEYREHVWLEGFRLAAENAVSLIFTFSPESTVRLGFPERCRSLIEGLGGELLFVELRCPDAVIEERIENKSRARFKKLASASEYRRLKAAGAFKYPEMPCSMLTIDTSTQSAENSAEEIYRWLQG